ncbi:MAG TPA: hypothetical protein VFZ21_17055 [Gemmatimonadaceae bacterium]|nr:hypothetical protein [Gemmatimonadaceae bacterium]
MSYDPARDEAKYSEAEVEALLDDVVKRAFQRGFHAGREFYLDAAAIVPLTIEGRWKRDTVYAPQSLVYHAGEQWIAQAQTASEPSVENALWRRVTFPRVNRGTRE